MPPPVPPPTAAALDPIQIPGVRILMASDDAIVWEHHVPAHTPYLPRMRQHTVSLCMHPPQATTLSNFPFAHRAAADGRGLLIVPAGETCQLQTQTALTPWSISLAPALLQRAQRSLAPSSTLMSRHGRGLPRLRAAAGIDDPVLESVVLALHHGVRGLRPAKRQFVDSMAQALSAHLVAQHCAASSAVPDQLGDDDLARLNAFLDSQFSERCSANDAAEMLGMSPMRFARLLKARTGQSFPRYCMQRRLERSFELLHSGQMSVTEAAMETCFASLAHFSRVFHKHFGVPPSALKP